MCAAHPNKTVEEFVALQQNVSSYHVSKAAVKLGVIAELTAGQRTANAISQALQLDPDATEMLLWALCETGLVESYGEDFALSQVGRLLADPHSLGDEHWSGLESLVRLGNQKFAAPPELSPGSLRPAGSTPSRVHALQWMEAPAALDAAEVLDFGRSRRGLRVLEVGGGSAVVSAALAHRDPDSVFVVLDQPEELERAQQTAQSIELENQFEFVVGDPRKPDIQPQAFDLILAAGQFHYVPTEEGAEWIACLARGLKPGGELGIIDWFGGQEKGYRAMAFFQLEVSLRVPGARLQRPQLLRQWMLEAGLNQVRFAHLPAPPHVWGLVLAEHVNLVSSSKRDRS